MDVAFEPASLLVLRADEPLPGSGQVGGLRGHPGQLDGELVGESDIAQRRRSLIGQLVNEGALGRREHDAGTGHHGDATHHLAAVLDGHRVRCAGAGGRADGPAGTAFAAVREHQPDLGRLRTHPSGGRARDAGQQLVGTDSGGEPLAEVHEDVVGRLPLPIHQARRQRLRPFPDRREGDPRHRCREHGQHLAGLRGRGTPVDHAADTDDDADVRCRHEQGEAEVDEGAVDHEVDVVEVVPQDRPSDGREQHDE